MLKNSKFEVGEEEDSTGMDEGSTRGACYRVITLLIKIRKTFFQRKLFSSFKQRTTLKHTNHVEQ